MSPAHARCPRLSVVLAGGGTAGHTSPLIATAHELVRLAPDAVVTALGTARGLETTVVPAAGLRAGADPAGAACPASPARTCCWCRPRLRRAGDRGRPAARPAGGGRGARLRRLRLHPGLPGGPASLGIPIVIHEQNVLPGLANKLAARFSDHVFTSFPDTPLPHATLHRAAAAAGDHRARPGRRTGSGPRDLRVAGRAARRCWSAADRRAPPASTRAVLGARSSLLAAGVSGAARGRAEEPRPRIERRHRPGDRGGLPARWPTSSEMERRVRRGRPDARPLRGQHRAGDRRRRAAGRVRALPARQRRAGVAMPPGSCRRRRRSAAGRRRLHRRSWVAAAGAQPDRDPTAARNGRGPGRRCDAPTPRPCWPARPCGWPAGRGMTTRKGGRSDGAADTGRAGRGERAGRGALHRHRRLGDERHRLGDAPAGRRGQRQRPAGLQVPARPGGPGRTGARRASSRPARRRADRGRLVGHPGGQPGAGARRGGEGCGCCTAAPRSAR